ncbi:MAG: hypothetical protein ABI638_11980 [Ignavibacteriota bacterium]
MYKHLKIFLIVIVFAGLSFSQAVNANQLRIAVLYSGLSEKLNDANSTKIIDTITTWELFLMQNKITYKVIYDDEIESGIVDDFDILILPSVNFISNDEFIELQNFLAKGKSIISLGSKLFFANHDHNDFQNLQTLFGVTNIESAKSPSISFQHSIIPNYLNQFKLDDDLVLQISNRNQALQSDNYEMNSYPYGYILDENDLNSKKSSILYGSVGNGKYLWTGFDPTDIIGGEDDLSTYKNLITNSLNWMDNKPDVYLQNFIDSLSSPIVFAIKYNNALGLELIDVLQKNNTKPILLVTPSQEVNKEILNRFEEDEIVFDLSENSNLTSNELIELVNKFNTENKIELQSILVNKEFLNKSDLNSLKENGIDKILFISPIFSLPIIVDDDIMLIPFSKNYNNQKSENVTNILYYNPKIDCEKNLEDELLTNINQLKSNRYNFASLNSIKKWWEIRERISAEVKSISENEIEIILNNKNSDEINNLKIFLNCNKNIYEKSLTISFNNSMLNYQFDNIADVLEISLNNIGAKSVNKIKVNFNIE